MKNFIGGLAFQKLLQGILHQTLCQNLRRVVGSRLLPFTSGKAIDESAFFIHTELAAIFPGFVADALILGVLAKLVFFYKISDIQLVELITRPLDLVEIVFGNESTIAEQGFVHGTHLVDA